MAFLDHSQCWYWLSKHVGSTWAWMMSCSLSHKTEALHPSGSTNASYHGNFCLLFALFFFFFWHHSQSIGIPIIICHHDSHLFDAFSPVQRQRGTFWLERSAETRAALAAISSEQRRKSLWVANDSSHWVIPCMYASTVIYCDYKYDLCES